MLSVFFILFVISSPAPGLEKSVPHLSVTITWNKFDAGHRGWIVESLTLWQIADSVTMRWLVF